MTLDEKIEEIEKAIERLENSGDDHSEKMLTAIAEALREERQTLKWLEELKAWRSGLLEDIKVEIENTNLEIAYRKGCNDALEKIKAEILKEYPCASNPKDKMIGYGIHIALEFIDKHIAELKGERDNE